MPAHVFYSEGDMQGFYGVTTNPHADDSSPWNPSPCERAAAALTVMQTVTTLAAPTHGPHTRNLHGIALILS